MSDDGAVATDCCLGGCDSGVAVGDGDAAATGAELTGTGEQADGAEAAGVEADWGLPVTMQILPEASQIRGFVTADLPAGCGAAPVVRHSLGDAGDCAAATEPHTSTNPVAIMPQTPLNLSILLTPPPV